MTDGESPKTEKDLIFQDHPLSENDPVALVELVNRVVDRGVVLTGEVTISVADVDLLYLGLRVLLCSPDRLHAVDGNVGLLADEAGGDT